MKNIPLKISLALNLLLIVCIFFPGVYFHAKGKSTDQKTSLGIQQKNIENKPSVKNITKANLSEGSLLKQLNQLIDSGEKSNPAILSLIRAYARANPRAAADFCKKLKHKFAADARMIVAEEWAKIDSRESWSWAASHENYSGRGNLLRYELMNVVSKTLINEGRTNELIANWSSLSSTDDKLAIYRLASPALSEDALDAVVAWGVNSYRANNDRSINGLFVFLADRLACQDMEVAISWAKTINEKSLQDSAIKGIVENISTYDGLSAATDAILSVAGEVETDKALASLLIEMKNPAALLTTAELIESPVLRDNAYKNAAILMANRNPYDAMSAANNINDRAAYFSVVNSIVRIQSKSSKETARAVLEKANKLSEAEKTTLSNPLY